MVGREKPIYWIVTHYYRSDFDRVCHAKDHIITSYPFIKIKPRKQR